MSYFCTPDSESYHPNMNAEIIHTYTKKFIKVKRLILNTPHDDDQPVNISGNFNDWKTQDYKFLMKKISKEKYEFEFPEG
jgi:hypothetical protein